MIELLPSHRNSSDMKRYFKIGTEFIIHDGESNILIFIGSEGEEKHVDSTLDPNLNWEINAYIRCHETWEISKEEFYAKLEREKAEAVERAKEAEKIVASMLPLPSSDYIPF